MKLSTYQALTVSVLGPCLIVFLGVQSTYWFNLRHALSNIEIVYTLSAVCFGVLAFKQINIGSKTKLALAWLVYIVVLAAIIFWVSLLTACGNGDCL